MKTTKSFTGAITAFFIILLQFIAICVSAQERVEVLPFGDFEQWTLRKIKESFIIGGKTKTLYMVAPNKTIDGPKYSGSSSPWGTSNAYAKAFGVEKVSVTVVPSKHNDGRCAKLETKLEDVSAAGINFKALATGSLYTGVLCNPVTLDQSKDPNSAINMGVPFTKRPKALLLDYKAELKINGQAVFADAGTKVKNVAGRDKGQIILILQHRWEENGHVYAYRVGTATEYITQSTADWVDNHRLNIQYSEKAVDNSHPMNQLQKNSFRTYNSKNKMVPIVEMGYRPDLAPTHLIIQISSGCMEPFTGCPGNIVWVDNIRLVYDDNSLESAQ